MEQEKHGLGLAELRVFYFTADIAFFLHILHIVTYICIL